MCYVCFCIFRVYNIKRVCTLHTMFIRCEKAEAILLESNMPITAANSSHSIHVFLLLFIYFFFLFSVRLRFSFILLNSVDIFFLLVAADAYASIFMCVLCIVGCFLTTIAFYAYLSFLLLLL